MLDTSPWGQLLTLACFAFQTMSKRCTLWMVWSEDRPIWSTSVHWYALFNDLCHGMVPTCYERHMMPGLVKKQLWLCVSLHQTVELSRDLYSSDLKRTWLCWHMLIYRGFLKWGYFQIIQNNRIFHYKPSILGYHHLRKAPYVSICWMGVQICPNDWDWTTVPHLRHRMTGCVTTSTPGQLSTRSPQFQWRASASPTTSRQICVARVPSAMTLTTIAIHCHPLLSTAIVI